MLRRRSGSTPTVAIALGGGGARGLCHIAALEALDELGVRPTVIAGTSIGAVIGAGYAAGMSGKDLRAYALSALRNRSELMRKLMRARVGRFSDLVFRGRGNPVLLDGEICLDLFWPTEVPDFFEELSTPLLVIATDFHRRCEFVMSRGPLGPAVAGSMAIPGWIRPVAYEDRFLIDGGAVNPLPYDVLFDRADIVVAIDVTAGPRGGTPVPPSPFQSMIGAAQIMQAAITTQKVKTRPPDILVRPGVDQFGILDFRRVGQILRAAEPARDELKRAITAQFEAALRD
ncbi:MAG: patatin-like phospholipase family protein [Bradyrhizobium sp.]|nr:MAG: patatin-like phospholipase family protein [Bradyrhizobium sp.]